MTFKDILESEENSEQEWVPDNGTGVEFEDYSITEPFDPTHIRVDTKQITIDLLLSRIKHGEIDLAPDFQRKAGIWKSEARSKLIESILIRIPLPTFYMDATKDEKWLVVDGLQRLTTLKEFAIDKTLRLSKLDYLKQLEGKTYDELHRSYQRRINETQVTAFLIEQGTPDDVKFNIFGKDAFRKRYKLAAPRSPINKALFESWSVNLSKLSDAQILLLQDRKTLLQTEFIGLMNTPDFNSAVSQGTGDTRRVKLRFSAIEQLIKEVLA